MTEQTKSPADDAKAPPAAAKAPAKKPAKAKKARAKKRAIDTATLTELASRVSAWPRGNMDELIGRLFDEKRLRLRTVDARTYVKMAGIEASAATDAADALVNWANAARRAVAGAG